MTRELTRRALLQAAGAAGIAGLLPAGRAGAAPPPGDGAAGRFLSAGDLRTEYAVDPLGLDAARPRLGWTLACADRGRSQSAYQVLVASSRRALDRGRGDLWNSGRVRASRSAGVEYGGVPLRSRLEAWWKLRVWDDRGRPSDWSAPARWEMGLLDPSDWAAGWIGGPVEPPLTLDGATWIWFPEPQSEQDPPTGSRYFRRTVELPTGVSGRLLLTADEQWTVYVNGELVGRSSGDPEGWRHATVLDVSAALRDGRNAIAIETSNITSFAGLVARLRAGATEVVTDASWRSANRLEPGWEQPGFDDAGWTGAQEIAPFGGGPWGANVAVPATAAPAPLLRRGFRLPSGVRRGRLYVCGLGYGVVHLNGERVGDRVLDPALTDYDDTVLYSVYDVSGLLHTGDNVVGVELGRGWYAMTTVTSFGWHRAPWRDEPKLLLRLEAQLDDGRTVAVVSDGSWRTADGPTRADSVYLGEAYDARLERPGWAAPGFDDTGWTPARRATAPRGRLRAQQQEPITVARSIRPVSRSQPRPGTYVFTFAENVSGWARLTVSGPAGTRVLVKYGEKLNPDGTVSAVEPVIQGELQQDSYVLRGEGTETWEPRFSYKGFRYVQLTGFPGVPGLDALEGRVVHSAVERVAELELDDPLLARIDDATRRTILNNVEGIPTDTPIYEKQGYTGDAELISGTAAGRFGLARFYEKWLGHDVLDTQSADGSFPGIAPTPPGNWIFDTPSPVWDAALFEIPWLAWEHYADERLLAAAYPAMGRYLDYLATVADGHVIRRGLGDWMPPGHAGAPPEGPSLTSTAYYHRFHTVFADVARALGHGADAARSEQTATAIRDAFNAAFLDSAAAMYRTERPAGYRQTSNVVPLAFGLVPDDRRDAVAARLAADVRARGNHLDTGIVGTRFILPVLTDHGHADLAYAIALQRSYPSWGYWLEQGMTTLLEAWDLGARSYDHDMFGTIGQWLDEHVAGLRPTGPGFASVAVRPVPPPAGTPGPQAASLARETVRGRIAVAWRRENGAFSLDVTLPPGVSGAVDVPAGDADVVLEGDRPIGPQTRGVEVRGRDGAYARFAVASGRYRFTTRAAPCRRPSTAARSSRAGRAARLPG